MRSKRAYYEAVIENNIEVVSQPKIDLDVASVKRGEDFTYKVTVAVKPEVQLGEYLNLEVKALPETVTEAELGLRIDQERERNAEMVLKRAELLKTTTLRFLISSAPSMVFPLRRLR